MTQTFNTNADRDIFIGQDGKLSISTGIDAVLKACESASYAQLGEMVLATRLGVPNFQAIWVGVPNYPLWESYLRKTLLNVDGVQGIKSLQISVDGNTLKYTATIQTVLGTGAIAGQF